MKLMDMSERRDLPDDVRHYILTLRAMVEECPLAMVALDRDDRVRMWSRGAGQMFGWTEEEGSGSLSPSLRGYWGLNCTSALVKQRN